MPKKYRLIFLVIFTIFFITVSSAITIYSLGYDIDFQTQTFKNTINIRVSTKPRNASVIYDGKEIIATPDDFPAPDNKLLPIQISKDSYMTENFVIYSKPKENTIARLSDIYLLPKDGKIVSAQPSNHSEMTILSDEYLMFKNDSSIYIQTYSLGGVQSNSVEIQIDKMIDVNTQNEMFDLDLNGITNLKWEKVFDTMFWNKEKGLIIYKNSDEWRLLNLSYLQFKTVNIARGSKNNLLLIDDKKNIWIVDLTSLNKIPKFINSNIDGIAFTSTPDSVWIWKDDSIYKISRDQANENLELLNLRDYRYTSSYLIKQSTSNADFKGEKFIAKALHQGMIFKIGSKVIYTPDFNKSLVQVLSNNTTNVAVEKDTVYWMDDQYKIYGHNLELNDRDSFGKVDINTDFDTISLSYNTDWQRLMIYTSDKVFSMWTDKDDVNRSVLNYSIVHWIDNAKCITNVYEKSQFCVRDNNLVIYQNRSFF